MIVRSSILFLLLAISCGKYDTAGNSQKLGKALQVSALSTTEKDNLTIICNALKQKEPTLPSTVGSGLTFTTTETDCDSKLISSGDIGVVLQGSSSNYLFKRKADSLDFIFPNVETSIVGVFQDICAPLAADRTLPEEEQTFQNPRTVAGVSANIYAEGVSSADCPPATGEYCIEVNTTNGQGKVTSKEWIRFRTNTTLGRVGYFTYRKKITQGLCQKNKYSTYTATLK